MERIAPEISIVDNKEPQIDGATYVSVNSAMYQTLEQMRLQLIEAHKQKDIKATFKLITLDYLQRQMQNCNFTREIETVIENYLPVADVRRDCKTNNYLKGI